MDPIAFLGWDGGRVLVGHGPFREVERAPSGAAAFFRNDFGLGAPKPWLVPQRWELATPAELGGQLAAGGELRADWDELDASPFAAVFEEINRAIRMGTFEKTVPVVAERGRLRAGGGRELMARALAAARESVVYGFHRGDAGFAGCSPEHLLALDGRQLRTMALAGTARSEERSVLAVDEKEIREHEFVVQALIAGLGDLGRLTRHPREVMELGSIVHFHTPIEVALNRNEPVDELIRRLHPTPALGPLPRTAGTMASLVGWRERLGVPAEFGAPFGAVLDGRLRAIVAIRGVWWRGDRLLLPAGCGVIEASRLVNEWRELRLKREAVKARLGLFAGGR